MYIPAGVIDLREIAAPATPPAGQARLYAKTDGLLYWLDDAGLERTVGSGRALATAITNTSANSVYPDGVTYWKYVTTTDAWPVNGFLTGTRNGTVHVQRLQAEATGVTQARYWINGSSAWSAWAVYLDAGDFTAKGDLLAGTAAGAFAVRSVGTNGQMLVADSAQASGLAWANAGIAPLTARTTAAVTNSTTTAATVTGLSLTVAAGKAYRIFGHGSFRTAASTTGAGIRLGGTATATRIRYESRMVGGAAANQEYFVYTALSQAFQLSAGVTLTTRGYPWELLGILVVNAAGTIVVEFASEVATSQVTIDADAYFELQEIA